MRLIDADELITKINSKLNKGIYKMAITEAINSTRTHFCQENGGLWFDYGNGTECSKCGFMPDVDLDNFRYFDYCPFCGCRMDGET